MNLLDILPGTICMDKGGQEWEYVGMSSRYDYVFIRYYETTWASMHEMKSFHSNGVEEFVDGVKLVRVREKA